MALYPGGFGMQLGLLHAKEITTEVEVLLEVLFYCLEGVQHILSPEAVLERHDFLHLAVIESI